MNSGNQILSLVYKNLLISYRNKEIFVEALLPIVVGAMLTLRGIYRYKINLRIIIWNETIDAITL